MNLVVAFSMTAALVGFGGLLLGVLNWKKQRDLRALLEFLAKQNEELAEELAERKADFLSDHPKVAEHARKIAWLEARVRRPNLAQEEIIEEKIQEPAEAQRLNISEQKHRVLRLASLGQDAQTIASKLGMMSGEVELIIKLNRKTV